MTSFPHGSHTQTQYPAYLARRGREDGRERFFTPFNFVFSYQLRARELWALCISVLYTQKVCMI